ncbi:hypothetical protein CKQ80_20575 [Pseudomonas moraviensis]|uniref:Uncharacterized protein n=1 Tax=Pseudomonas moraviensis TaxID=321662 RepID=A0A2A2PPQ1_9PSED|nr:hypothetical protein CKQ68_08635 [Pseudomonas moraviensis]PAW57589.1 hypothetical protein CKQ80_20575 [Pseudomonas moraviensis]
MRGKLQNFAKAAILATVREICSNDEHLPQRARFMAPERTVRRSDDAPVKLFGQIIVNNRDDCITLFR